MTMTPPKDVGVVTMGNMARLANSLKLIDFLLTMLALKSRWDPEDEEVVFDALERLHDHVDKAIT